MNILIFQLYCKLLNKRFFFNWSEEGVAIKTKYNHYLYNVVSELWQLKYQAETGNLNLNMNINNEKISDVL